jgi:hypothetical protein
MYAALHDEDSGSTVGDWLTNRFLTRGPEVARATTASEASLNVT